MGVYGTIKRSETAAPSEKLSPLATALLYVTLLLICALAFSIRLVSVVRYESIIHEFDPYFNFRATKYLAQEGFLEFLNWVDDRSWYPLGRAVGGTVYPGLMVTAAMFYWAAMAAGIPINIRNVCVFVAPVFSALASIASFLLTREVTRRSGAGLLAAAFTAIVPSYISRSVGGSFDNEGVAIFALILCFYLWVKAVHNGSMMWACLCALSYYYMVASWGGYIFIINLIPIYVIIMILAGRYSERLYVAYSIFYVLGSLCAMTVPFVGFNVIDRAECAASHGVFIGLQLYAASTAARHIVGDKLVSLKTASAYASLAAIVAAVAGYLIRLQLTGGLQWTGRSLTLLDPTYASKFIPIIASVSEHQPSTWTAYFFDLHILVPLSPAGMLFLFHRDLTSDGAVFLLLYGTVAWYFAGVMVRLMLTLAPVACILSGVAVSHILTRFSAIIKQNVWWAWNGMLPSSPGGVSQEPSVGKTGRVTSSASFLVIAGIYAMLLFYNFHCVFCAVHAYSSPSIVVDGGYRPDGTPILLDDFREAYFWLRQNTDSDAKILSWWDYGYQLSAMANRTVLVDNNTWNNTHIATVGRVLASSEEDAYPILESLDVDYVLVVFGGKVGYSSDDINKLLWPVRIGRGVFPHDIPGDEAYIDYNGMNIGSNGPPALINSVAYKLCYYRFNEILINENGAPSRYDYVRNQDIGKRKITLKTMEESFTSENWLVRIYKVLKRPNLDALSNTEAALLHRKNNSYLGHKDSTNRKKPGTEATFVGCYSSEALFEEKLYGGGNIGASIEAGILHAVTNGRKYIAFASTGSGSGHAFAFTSFSKKSSASNGDRKDTECNIPCDDESTMTCGCADRACTGGKLKGEKNNRRWSVYELSARKER